MSGRSAALLIAFEGLDQSGKQTQADALRSGLRALGRESRLLSFPDYSTPIGGEIARALHGGRDYAPDVMQLLYVANRHEKKPVIEASLAAGMTVVCDRYIASSVAYGEAQGLDAVWLADIQRFLPPPDLSILLDIAPRTAAERKTSGRDRYERDLTLLSRVRESYRRQAAASAAWLLVDGERAAADVHAEVLRAVSTRLAQR
jgi:dTMP kinase